MKMKNEKQAVCYFLFVVKAGNEEYDVKIV